MSTSVTNVVKHFPSAENGFTTTTSGSVSSGATTVGLNSVAGYTNGETAVFVIDPTDATKKQTFTGVIDTSGVQVTGVIWTAGTNVAHASGATVVDYATATHISMVSKGILVDHDQSGQHKNLTDANGNEWIKQTATASAVNEITVANAATTKPVTLSATGGDTNIDMHLKGKGTGKAHMDSYSEIANDFVQSGMVWSGDSYGSTLAASMTAGVCYINGRRINIAAVTAHAFTASKDTYVDILDNADGTGTVVYTEATNNAASSALAANSLRIAIIVSGAGNIAAVGSINQGQTTKVLPIASSIPYAVTDSLGNLICPRSPNRGQIGYRQATANTSTNVTASGSTPTITGLTMPIIIPANRKVEITYQGSRVGNDTSGNGAELSLWDGATGSGTLLDTMNINGAPSNNFGVPMTGTYTFTNDTASAVSKTFRVGLLALTGGNATLLFISNTTIYGKISARLI